MELGVRAILISLVLQQGVLRISVEFIKVNSPDLVVQDGGQINPLVPC